MRRGFLQSAAFARVRRLTLAVAALMSVVLLTMLAYEARQLSTLRESMSMRGDYTVWAFFQLEAEGMRLRERLIDHVEAPTPERHAHARDAASVEDVRRSFELFVSRIGLVRPERADGALPELPSQRATVAELDRFVARFEPWLAESAQGALPRAVASDALVALAELQPRMREMSLDIQHLYAEVSVRRSNAIADQVETSLRLSMVHVLVLGMLVAMLLLQLQALGARQRRLVGLLRRLRQARQRARDASAAKTRFLANMSHEIRTPLQGIIGQLSLVGDSACGDEHAQHVRVAQDSAQQLLAVLNDVIDVTRIEAGRLRLLPGPCHPVELATKVSELFRPVAAAKGIALTHHADALVPARVTADVARLRQILVNLVSNAIKFTERGSVWLRVTAEPSSTAGQVLLRFEVEDTGEGIDDETLGRLFQRFAQAESGMTRRHDGAGLGLEISRGLARLMGGDLTVSSTPGLGSRFTLTVEAPLVATVPSSEAPQDAFPAAAAAPAGSDGGEPGAVAALDAVPAALQVLVVDDNPINRRFLEHALRALGHRSVLARGGDEALAHASQGGFDAVLMDVHMPGIDGLAATENIRRLPAPQCAVPVVAITADVMPETASRAAAAGVDAMLYKPFTKEDVAQLLQVVAGRRAPAT